MKIALTNLCKTEDFAKHVSYQEALNFLDEEGVEYLDFCSGDSDLDNLVSRFNESLSSEVDIIWVVCGGWSCLKALDKIDWKKVVESNKKFYGLSDFTHFSSKAVSLGVKCYYGQGLTYIKQFFPTTDSRKFIVNFLKTGFPSANLAKSLLVNSKELDVNREKIVGGHMLIFAFMQNQININLKERYIFLEYHHGANGVELKELEYYLNQVLYTINNNFPKGFILGRSLLKNLDGTELRIEEINDFLVSKLLRYRLPIYYIDHFNNIVTFC